MAKNCTLKKALAKEILSQKDEPIAVFGNGTSAQGLRKLFQKFDLKYIIYDQNPEKGEAFTSKSVKNHRMVICSPSFLRDHPWVVFVHRNRLLCLSELDFASLWCAAPIVAITGTNGKTTITTFLTEIFNRSGFRAFCAGNIGQSLAEVVATEALKADDLIFCETSSFQAESLQFIRFLHLIWSNFAPSHLNMHKTIRKYFLAKYHLLVHLNESSQIVLGESVAQWARKFQCVLPQKTVIAMPKSDTNCTAFKDYPQRENFAIIKEFCATYHIPPEVILAEAERFQKPKYRLENMGIIRGNTYWND
jgi:UDP-N-acetylmuramoylalanine--D-glutamate ligase